MTKNKILLVIAAVLIACADIAFITARGGGGGFGGGHGGGFGGGRGFGGGGRGFGGGGRGFSGGNRGGISRGNAANRGLANRGAARGNVGNRNVANRGNRNFSNRNRGQYARNGGYGRYGGYGYYGGFGWYGFYPGWGAGLWLLPTVALAYGIGASANSGGDTYVTNNYQSADQGYESDYDSGENLSDNPNIPAVPDDAIFVPEKAIEEHPELKKALAQQSAKRNPKNAPTQRISQGVRA